MSRHHILLPVAGADTDKTLGVVCGFDRHPYEHFYCNVSNSLSSDDIDEPTWSSILDADHARVTTATGFDAKLASMGITLPAQIKRALEEDWDAKDMGRVTWWGRKEEKQEEPK